MTDHLTEADVLAAVPGLTRTRLFAFIETETVLPLRHGTGDDAPPVFRSVDLARVRLLCDLLDDLDLDEGATGVVIALIDQLHAARRDLRVIARAVQSEPQDVRTRIGSALLQARG